MCCLVTNKVWQHNDNDLWFLSHECGFSGMTNHLQQQKKIFPKFTNFCTKFYAQNRCFHGSFFSSAVFRSWTSRQDPTSTGQYHLPGANLFFTICRLHMVMIFYDFARTWTMTRHIGVLLISKSDISAYLTAQIGEWFGKKSQVPFCFDSPCAMCPFGFPPNWAEKPLPGTPAESVCMWPEQNRVLVDDRSPPKSAESLQKIDPFFGESSDSIFFPGQPEISEKNQGVSINPMLPAS